MGVKYEMNWYLVVDDEERIELCYPYGFHTKKDELRIYPLDSMIPLIIKNKGCVGIIKIQAITLEENKTFIYFDYEEKFNIYHPIAKHYYDMYLRMKG